MRWITGGPDLSPELLQAQEDGQLVLFCGAGVSYPAGLPDFRGLVEQVYVRLSATMGKLERIEFEKSNYDRVFGLLEKRLVGGFVRPAVLATLQIDPAVDLPTHRSLLALATTRQGVCRIVTTNFDRGFEMSVPPGTVIDVAPRLPVPKGGVWNSVVHLHGLISDEDPQGRSLVLTSADFGAAYLTERWASRFISDLFRRFTILFVGYSVEDPVVRYMMDAFAADRALGEGVGKAYVLAPSDEPSRRTNAEMWEAKGVIPLLYDESDGHKALHLTLAKWAECHRNGLRGKESVVLEYGSTTCPMRPFEDDPVVTQVAWAIAEPSGHAAQVFAGLDPLPPLEWLDVFADRRMLGLETGNRESPLVDSGYASNGPAPLHPVTRGLSGWVIRHLDKTELLNWVLRAGSSLHPEFRDALRRHLETLPTLPPGLARIWNILASETALQGTGRGHHLFQIQTRLTKGDWNAPLKFELVDAFTPVLTLRPAVLPIMFPDEPFDGARVDHFAEVEVVPRCGVHSKLLRHAIDSSPVSARVLRDLADDATGLLKRAMELFEIVERADARFDSSYSDQPSISPHEQNSAFRDWTTLIGLVRDAWWELLAVDRDSARRLAERWRSIRYPVFRRLTFYAMAESDLYTAEECLACLLEDDGWWLWSIYVYREKFRLLSTLWPKVSSEDADRLVNMILAGPPRSMFRDDISEDCFQRTADREKWLHLSKLRGWGRELTQAGSDSLGELSTRYPEWKLVGGERDEFVTWGESGWGERPVENPDEFLNLPDGEVLTRLSGATLEPVTTLARWRRVVAEKPVRAVQLLSSLGGAGSWPGDIWKAAIEGFAAEKRSGQAWPDLANALGHAPDALILEITSPLAWLLKDVAQSIAPTDDGPFWQVWDRLQPFAFTDDGDDPTDPVTAAINTAAGHLVQALLDRVAARRPRTSGDVPDEVWQRLTTLAEGQNRSYQFARVILSSRLAWFHSTNPAWTERCLLPCFDWDNCPEAPAVWQGYLWQARLTPELWAQIKGNFLKAFGDKARLGKFEEHIARLFAFICIDQPGWVSEEEARTALRTTDAKGRAAVATVVWKRIEGAGEKGASMWSELVGPWLERAWPKDRGLTDADSSLNLAMAVTHVGEAFAAAVANIAPFLIGSDHHSLLVERLLATEYPERYTSATLRLAALVVDIECRWPDPKLRELLTRIQHARPELANELGFRRLDDFLSRNL